MSTVQKIKSILDRKVILEQNISEANRAINHLSLSDLVTSWTPGHGRLDVRVNRELFREMMRAQVEADKAELATINKQLDAIGALMGVE